MFLSLSSVLDLQWASGLSLLFLVLVLSLLLMTMTMKAPENFPPGPRALPVIGDLHRVHLSRFHLHMSQMAEEYGDVFSLHLLGRRVVIVTGYRSVKEALVQKGEDYLDRPVIPSMKEQAGVKGILYANGTPWKEQRKFAHHTLRQLDTGRALESMVQDEALHLIQAFSAQQGNPFDAHLLVNFAVSNIICSTLFGNRNEYDDEGFRDFVQDFNDLLYLNGSVAGIIYDSIPWLMGWLPGPHQRLFTLKRRIWNYFDRKIEEHRANADSSAPRDYVDHFLRHMGTKEEKASTFYVDNLTTVAVEMYGGASETTATTMMWGLLFMIRYPHVQEKVQAEIDVVIGSSRPPSLSDRDQMPFTDAVVHEMQRLGVALPFVPRCTSKETRLNNYTIPKGTMVLPMLSSVLQDKTMWETPETFNPQHFLNEEGRFRKREAFMPFSAGKRACPGEQMARLQLFLFFTSILQRFVLSAPAGEKPTLDFVLGSTHCPKPYRLCATLR